MIKIVFFLLIFDSLLAQARLLDGTSKEEIQLAKFLNEITKLNDELTCTEDKECEELSFGFKSCGGPTKWILASHKNKKFNELQSLIKKHNKLDNSWKIKNHIMSTCDIELKPIAYCFHNSCVSEIARPVNAELGTLPMIEGLALDENTRIKSAEQLKKLQDDWRAKNKQEIPEHLLGKVNFSRDELISYSFCKTEKNGEHFLYSLSSTTETSKQLFLEYQRHLACVAVAYNPCVPSVMAITKSDKSLVITYRNLDTPCRKVK